MIKVGVVGAGRIVPYHLDSLMEAGFIIDGICATPNSPNARSVALRYEIPRVYDRVEDLIESEVDAILIAVSKEMLFEVLSKALSSEKKILIEKPVFISPKQSAYLNSENVMVAYNRRFYGTVNALKQRIQSTPGGSLYCHIPELSSQATPTPSQIIDELIGNTVHYLDLVRYLIKDQQSNIETKIIENFSSSRSCFVKLQSENTQALIHLTFGSPGNYRIHYENGRSSILLSPLESFVEFNDMQVMEPSKEFPLRRYLPSQKDGARPSFFEDTKFKPGFLGQSQEFLQFVKGKPLNRGSNLDDAYMIANLAFEIAKSVTKSAAQVNV